MKRFVVFVAIGSAFATVEEFLTVAVLRHDVPSYLFTLVVLFPLYLTFVYLSCPFLDRLASREPARDLVHLLAYGSLGLLREWTLMGLSPWSNPAANPFLMLGFQVGMFAFWATVATAPRAFLDYGCPGRDARRRILGFYVPYFAMVYVVGLSIPEGPRFGAIIPPHPLRLPRRGGTPAPLGRRSVPSRHEFWRSWRERTWSRCTLGTRRV